MNPELTQDQRNQLEALAEEYARRKRRGDEVTLEEYVDQYPELASDIRELFPVVAMLDKAGGRSSPLIVPDSSEPIEPGTRLGEYQLLRVIGRGGMGVVYQAEHIALGSIAAIKVLPASRSGPKGRERFQREASAAARMHHPNIVRVFDFGCHRDSLYYVMPLVEGWGLDRLIGNQAAISDLDVDEIASKDSMPPTKHDLADTLARSDLLSDDPPEESNKEPNLETGPVAADRTHRSSSSGSRPDDLWSWVARLGVQAADALDYAHSIGIVHRDVKPSNLMIDADNHVYVTDFGLAKIVDEHTLTGTGDLLGTLRYMPPEAFAGRADQRSDIYGLGLTLYELLADRPALTESERGPLMTAIMEGRIAKLGTLVPGIPRDLQTVIHKAIDVDPATRYPAASDFRDDLQRFVSGQPIQARRSTWAYRTSRWISRNRAVASLTALAILVLVAGLIVSSIGWSRALFAEADAKDLAEKEKQARTFAESETSAKDKALSEKQRALEKEAEERRYAAAISGFVRDDFLALTSVHGQDRFNDIETFELGRNTTLKELLDRAAMKLAERTDLHPVEDADLRWMIGKSYRGMGEYKNATMFLDESYVAFRKYLGLNSPATIGAAIELTGALRVNGEHKKSIEFANRIIRELSEIPGENETDLVPLMGQLVMGLDRDGQLYEARLTCQRIVQLTRSFDPDSSERLFADSLMASCLLSTGEYEKALMLSREVYQRRCSVLSKDHYLTISSLLLLVDVERHSGNREDALSLCEKAYSVTQKKYGDKHPFTIASLHALGSNCRELGQLKRAVKLLKQASLWSHEKLGADHPQTLAINDSLGSSYVELQQFDKAMRLLAETSQMRKDVLGIDHPLTLQSMNNYGVALARSGKQDEAEQTYLETLRMKREKLGENHPDLIATLSNLATLYRATGRREQGMEMYSQAFQKSCDSKGAGHPDTLMIQNKIAVSYWKDKRLDKSVPMFEQLVQVTRENLGENSPQTLRAMANLAVNYRDAGQLEEAIDQLHKTLLLRMQILDENHPDIVVNLNQLAKAYEKKRNWAEAAKWFEKALEKATFVYGERDGRTQAIENSVAVNFWKLNQLDKSIPLFESMVDRYKKLNGNDAPRTLRAMANLAVNYRDAGRIEETIPLLEKVVGQIGKDPQFIWAVDELLNAYAKCGQFDDLRRVVNEQLTIARTSFDTDSQGYCDLVNECARGLFFAGLVKEAEPLLREMEKLDSRQAPGSWNHFLSQSLLGQAILKQADSLVASNLESDNTKGIEKLAESKSFLTDGFAGMLKTSHPIPGLDYKTRLEEAVDALIQHSTLVNDSEAKARWQKQKALMMR